MQLKRQTIAKGVAERLFAAEAALDIAAARIAELNAALPLARLDARIAATVGQDAFHSSAAAMMLVAQTRAEIVATHGHLKRASDDVGLQEVSYGDVFKPRTAGERLPGGHLRAA